MIGGKNIVILPGSLELGGSERQAIHLANFLRNKIGVQVSLWGFGKPGLGAQILTKYGIEWRRIPFNLPSNPILSLANVLRFGLLLRTAEPDVLLPYGNWANVASGLTWRQIGAQLCIWNQRDVGLFRLEGWIEGRAVNRVPVFISNSKQGAQYLIRTFKVDANRIHIIHNGVSLPDPIKDRDSWRKKLRADSNTFVACMIGNVTYRKDHATLLRAWHRVVSKLPNARLVLAGSLGDSYENLSNITRELNLSKNVIFLGQVYDITGLLASVEMGVFSSIQEGCPNGVLECMAAGLAVAATNIEGVREAVGPSGYPFLADPGDANGLADRILSLTGNASLRKSIGAKNLDRANKEFQIDRMCVETLKLIEAGL